MYKRQEPGNTEFLWGDQVDKTTFDRIKEQTVAQGGQPAAAKPVRLGITKASLETESFISAAAFQDTTRVRTEASTLGKTDTLEGFKAVSYTHLDAKKLVEGTPAVILEAVSKDEANAAKAKLEEAGAKITSSGKCWVSSISA